MSKMSKAIAVLGVVAGLGVAAMPLSSYAASSDIEQAQVQVKVGGSINLTLDKAASDTTSTWTQQGNILNLGEIKINGDVATGAIDAKVETNDVMGYTLSMRALNEGVMKGDSGIDIPNVAPAKGTAGWGYNLDGGATFTQMPTTDTMIVSDGNTAAITPAPTEEGAAKADATTTVTFGVAADSSIPEGTYTGTVVFTAAVK